MLALLAISSSTIVAKSATALAARLGKATGHGSPADRQAAIRCIAVNKGICWSNAQRASACIDLAPMPRGGTLITRDRLTSSAGLCSRCR